VHIILGMIIGGILALREAVLIDHFIFLLMMDGMLVPSLGTSQVTQVIPKNNRVIFIVLLCVVIYFQSLIFTPSERSNDRL